MLALPVPADGKPRPSPRRSSPPEPSMTSGVRWPSANQRRLALVRFTRGLFVTADVIGARATPNSALALFLPIPSDASSIFLVIDGACVTRLRLWLLPPF